MMSKPTLWTEEKIVQLVKEIRYKSSQKHGDKKINNKKCTTLSTLSLALRILIVDTMTDRKLMCIYLKTRHINTKNKRRMRKIKPFIYNCRIL